jgi:predicted dienelactone hydrolase
MASVPEGKDVISLSEGSKVGYRVMDVSATDERGQRSTTSVAVWYPTEDAERPFEYQYGKNSIRTHLAEKGKVAPGRYPLVVFSHGATGSGLTSAFVTETMARHGFIVAAVDHTDDVYLARIRPDAAPKEERGQAFKALAYAMKVLKKWMGDEAVASRPEISYRPAQVRVTIDLLVNASKDGGSPFAGRVDTEKIGVMGHSFGAWTTMIVAGAVKKYADPRVTAAITLSAPVNGTVFSAEEVGNIRVPLMMMFGSTEVRQGRGDDRKYFYDHLSGPKYMVEIENADHTTFSGGIRKEYPTLEGYLAKDANRAAIARYAVAFMSYSLKGDAEAHKQLKIRGNGVSNYIYEE